MAITDDSPGTLSDSSSESSSVSSNSNSTSKASVPRSQSSVDKAGERKKSAPPSNGVNSSPGKSLSEDSHGEGVIYDASYKVILLGDSGVGKSNLLSRFTKGLFHTHSKPTVGVEFASKTLKMDNHKLVRAQIWDTAGQERYRLIASSYYRRALGALLVYDVTSKTSFENIPKWLREVEDTADEDCLVMLVGNKIDLSKGGRRAVTLADGRDFAMKNKIAFIETSAKENTGVDAAFHHLLQAIYNLQGNKQQRMAMMRKQQQQQNDGQYDVDSNENGFKLSPTDAAYRRGRYSQRRAGCCRLG